MDNSKDSYNQITYLLKYVRIHYIKIETLIRVVTKNKLMADIINMMNITKERKLAIESNNYNKLESNGLRK